MKNCHINKSSNKVKSTTKKDKSFFTKHTSIGKSNPNPKCIDFNEKTSSFTKVSLPQTIPISNVSKQHFCTCEKSKCQKKYCNCYANGEVCNSLCQCFDCRNFNSLLNDHNNDKQTIKDTFTILSDNTKPIFCTCTKSNCIKNYCDCYKANKQCTSKCRCLDCKNNCFILSKKKDPKNKMIIEYIRVEINHGEIISKEGKLLLSKASKVFSTNKKTLLNESNIKKEEADDEFTCKKRLYS